MASGSYTASEQYQGLIDRISAALDSGDTETAHPLLEYGLQLMPDNAQERAALLQLKAREQAMLSYRKSSVAIDVARDNSDILLEHFAPSADPHGVFSGLNPEPDPAWLSFIIHWRFAIATILLLGFLGIIAGFAGFTYTSMLPAESSTKSTMVAIIRSPTPIPATFTPTPTASPVNTQAPTLTFTPSSTPTATPIPTLGIGSISIRQNDKMRMVYVPAGAFTMGSDTKNEEKPVKLITMDAYWIDEIEVTNSMYQLCIQAKSCPEHLRNASFSHANYYSSPEFALYPVLQITWHQAVTYCKWAGGRLPTEAEWEKAARGSDERMYPWGHSIDKSFANYSRSVGDTSAAGSYIKGASPYGVLDMSGNVIEWVNSLFMPYPYNPNDGREDPTAYGARVLRGGTWSDNATNVRTSYRAKFLPTNQGDHLGFRCATDPTP